MGEIGIEPDAYRHYRSRSPSSLSISIAEPSSIARMNPIKPLSTTLLTELCHRWVSTCLDAPDASGHRRQRFERQPKAPCLVVLELRGVPAEERLRVGAVHRRDKVWEQVMKSFGPGYKWRLVPNDTHGLNRLPKGLDGTPNVGFVGVNSQRLKRLECRTDGA